MMARLVRAQDRLTTVTFEEAQVDELFAPMAMAGNE